MITSERIDCAKPLGALEWRCSGSKENPAMTALLVIIALLAAAAVVSTVIVASRDGYRRLPAIERY